MGKVEADLGIFVSIKMTKACCSCYSRIVHEKRAISHAAYQKLSLS